MGLDRLKKIQAAADKKKLQLGNKLWAPQIPGVSSRKWVAGMGPDMGGMAGPPPGGGSSRRFERTI